MTSGAVGGRDHRQDAHVVQVGEELLLREPPLPSVELRAHAILRHPAEHVARCGEHGAGRVASREQVAERKRAECKEDLVEHAPEQRFRLRAVEVEVGVPVALRLAVAPPAKPVVYAGEKGHLLGR
eukprot:CAMPEP_0179840952 /NCGR_PEP_ID=MMETSP0982-20121206/2224_1 /TAXON_ID=483367 /ORGANISM="non described non described, Strain CCMP 2436" /LENGTH=125 /DNA_ID=CAMNT_0021724905 /DNA_START=478 /DNA_END=852 /DNA_ORIENTATION=-